MHRREFLVSAAALTAVVLLPPVGLQQDIIWTEQGFDFDNQFAIAGEYNGRRQAARLRKRVRDITPEDKQRLKQLLTDWFLERSN